MIAATAWRRFIAKLVDAGLTVPLYVFAHGVVRDERWALAIAYAVFMLWDAVGSPGKAMLGIKCIDVETGRTPSPWHALLRNSVFVPSLVRAELRITDGTYAHVETVVALAVSLLLIFFECNWMWSRRDVRRLGDALGNTRVVVR